MNSHGITTRPSNVRVCRFQMCIRDRQYTMPFIVGNARILYFNMDILEPVSYTHLGLQTWMDAFPQELEQEIEQQPGKPPR